MLSIQKTAAHHSGCPPTPAASDTASQGERQTVWKKLNFWKKELFTLAGSVLLLKTGKQGEWSCWINLTQQPQNPSWELWRRQVKCWLDSTVKDGKGKLTDFDPKRVKPNLSSAVENQVKTSLPELFPIQLACRQGSQENNKSFRRENEKAAQGSAARWQQCRCLCVGKIKDMTGEMMPSSTSSSSFPKLSSWAPLSLKIELF